MVIKSQENLIGAWAFLIGAVLAVIVGLISSYAGASVDPLLVSILAILGFIVGYFVSEKDVQTFLLASISLVIVSFAGIQSSIFSAAVLALDMNTIITSVLRALMVMFVPATIVVALKTVFSLAKS